jgi:hypothetical protein
MGGKAWLFTFSKNHKKMNELEEYYKSEIYENGMPEFEHLDHWQRSAMVNGGAFNRWKVRRSFEAFRDSVFKALRLPALVSRLSRLIK